MKEIKVNELTDNLFETISKEWMLVTAGTKDKFNTMTANWGGAGFLWNRPVAFIFIRPERYTFDFIEQNDYLTLSFLGEEHKEVHKICGSKSGRDMDKVKATGLSPLFTENGSITFEQARQETVCRSDQARKLYRQEHYGPMVWGITRWFSQDVCGGNCKCAKPLINGIDCFFTAASCIDYIKGYDLIRKKPVKLYV